MQDPAISAGPEVSGSVEPSTMLGDNDMEEEDIGKHRTFVLWKAETLAVCVS